MYHVFYCTDGEWSHVISTRNETTRDLVIAILGDAAYTAW